MSVGAVSNPLLEPVKTVYLVERRPPQSAAHPLLEKIKQIAGTAIALFGLVFLTFTAAAFLGTAAGLLSFTIGNLEMSFMIGLIATVAGFNLATKGSQTSEVYLGPLSVTV